MLNNFYVDDCLQSVFTELEAAKLICEVGRLLSGGSFRLHKFLSNNQAVLQSVPEADQGQRTVDQVITPKSTERVFGVMWDVATDHISIVISKKTRPVIRRGILSIVSSIFDPLGFVSSFVLLAKEILKELSKRTIDWKEEFTVRGKHDFVTCLKWKNSR